MNTLLTLIQAIHICLRNSVKCEPEEKSATSVSLTHERVIQLERGFHIVNFYTLWHFTLNVDGVKIK